MSELQDEVSRFIEANGLRTDPEYRLLDLVSEVGELSKDVNESTGYGSAPDQLEISEDEIGDVMFALAALADSQGVDVEAALETALEKYSGRMQTGESPSSANE